MESNRKRLFLYIGYLIIFYLFLYLSIHFLIYFNYIAKSTLIRTPVMIYTSIYPIILGVIAGLPNFIKQVKLNGKWKVDSIKLIVVGIPTFYIGISYIILIIGSKTGITLFPTSLSMFYTYGTGRLLSGFIFGYILLDSFKKK